ncbi:MAG: putative transposase [Halioglobus sp.]|jgi:putative transposase
MARRNRIHLPRSTYHVMLRGNNGKKITHQKNDFSRMCLLIQEGIERYGHSVLGFCFMSNHVHLVIRIAEVPLSKIMQNLAFRYTRYINVKYKHIGHLFQGRFKSILVDDTQYLYELIRYVHLNPVRAKLVQKPEDYYWSGHHTYLGKEPFQWVSTSRVLKKFGTTTNGARKGYCDFIYRGIDVEPTIDFETGNQKGVDILGNDVFTENLILEKVLRKQSPWTQDGLIHLMCESYAISIEELRQNNKNRKASRIRSILSLLIRENPTCSLTELTKTLDKDISALSRSATRLETKLNKDEVLRLEIESIKEKLNSNCQMSKCQPDPIFSCLIVSSCHNMKPKALI